MADNRANYIKIKIEDFYENCVGEEEYIFVSPEVYELLKNTFRKEENAEYMRDYRNRTIEGYIEGMTELSVEEGESLEDMVIRKIYLETLQKAFKSLNKLQKERLYMYFFEGISIDEIARIYGTTKMPVWRSIQGAIKKIEKYFK